KWPQPPMAPVSSVHRREKSLLRARRFCAAAISTLRRAFGPCEDHSGKARAAASQAARTSAGEAAAARETTPPVAGLRRSKVAPLFAATPLPAMESCTAVIASPFRVSLGVYARLEGRRE